MMFFLQVKANGAQSVAVRYSGPTLLFRCCAAVTCGVAYRVSRTLLAKHGKLDSVKAHCGGIVSYAQHPSKLLAASRLQGGYGGLVKELVGAANIKEWALKNILSTLPGMAKFALTDDGKWARVISESGYAGMHSRGRRRRRIA